MLTQVLILFYAAIGFGVAATVVRRAGEPGLGFWWADFLVQTLVFFFLAAVWPFWLTYIGTRELANRFIY
jgi:hypothetical protein